MRRFLITVICFPILLLTSCDVHEWPEFPDRASLHLNLNYETDMTEWFHVYKNKSVNELYIGDTYDNHQSNGKIRYIIRAYPITKDQHISQNFTQEFVFTKDISEGYNHSVTIDLKPGNYNIMVWSDLLEEGRDSCFYDAKNFAEIMLTGKHIGSNNYRDAFRGTNNLVLSANIIDNAVDTLNIKMQRPLAKFEFRSNDVKEFIYKEVMRLAEKANSMSTARNDEINISAINMKDYKVVFYYVGFMANGYSLFTDKRIDCNTGVKFESSITKLNDNEASIGFDYIFANDKVSTVTVRVGIYDNEGVELSMTEPIDIPVKRNYHTILTGNYLTSKASGGIAINPDFEDDYNIIFP